MSGGNLLKALLYTAATVVVIMLLPDMKTIYPNQHHVTSDWLRDAAQDILLNVVLKD